MTEHAMMRGAFQAILKGDTAERDRLIAGIHRNRRDPDATIGPEQDTTMAEQVNALGKDFTKTLLDKHPDLFSGDTRSMAIATLALAEVFGGIMASAHMHGGDKRAARVMQAFSDRASQSFGGIGDLLASKRQ